MHHLQVLRVEADSPAGLEDAVAAMFECRGEVDYWTIGGRWAGGFDGADYLHLAAAGRDQVVELLEQFDRIRIRELRRGAVEVLGIGTLTVDDLPTFGAGLPPGDDETVERFDVMFRKDRDALRRDLERLFTSGEQIGDHSMLGWAMRKLGTLLCGMWQTGTVYYDTINQTTSIAPLIGDLTNPETLTNDWLVIVDVHT